MNVLVINCGSSSLKFSVVDTQSGANLAQGLFEKLGSDEPAFELASPQLEAPLVGQLEANSAHAAALDRLAVFLASPALEAPIEAIGHRVVHGGEHFTSASLICEETLDAVRSCAALAPLHNPANLQGIETSREHFPSLPQVAVFDTAFHQTLAPEAYLYALPIELYRKHGIRRYGFHGSSHKFVSAEAARQLGKSPDETSIITAHLGNGCSAAAIQNGKCVDTTMGLTPLEGLVMGTRCGDIDPSIILHLSRSYDMSIKQIDTMLNKNSGLLGLSEYSNDMRSLREASSQGNEAATLAISIFVRRLSKSIASLRATLEDCDAIVFTGGIGENDALTRAETIARLKYLGVELDAEANAKACRGGQGIISTESSSTKAIVVRTNEELMIARETAQIIGK